MQDPASFGLHAKLEPIQAIKALISCISPLAMAVSLQHLQTFLIKATAMDTADMSSMTSWLHHVLGMHTHLLLIARQIRFTTQWVVAALYHLLAPQLLAAFLR